MNSGAGPLVMVQVPSPLAKAIGIEAQPGVCLTSAMSVSPFPLKSPVMIRTPGVGAQEGIKFDFDRIPRTPNTVKSHRLLYAAAEEGKQPELLEMIFAAYFTQGIDIGDADVLSGLGSEAGLSGAAIADALTDGSRLDSVMTEDLQSRRGLQHRR